MCIRFGKVIICLLFVYRKAISFIFTFIYLRARRVQQVRRIAFKEHCDDVDIHVQRRKSIYSLRIMLYYDTFSQTTFNVIVSPPPESE